MTIAVASANQLLDSMLGSNHISYFTSTVNVGLSSTQPAIDGTNTTEPVGGAYAEVTVANTNSVWSLSSNAQKTNAIAITFPTATASWGNVSYFFVKSSTGVFMCAGAIIGAPISITNASTPSFGAGALVATLS